MSSPIRSLVILGALGDLTSRLLLPGVGRLLASSRGEEIELIGAGADELSDDDWRERVRDAFARAGVSSELGDRVANGARYLRADATDADDLRSLLAACSAPPALYFALPPAVTVASCAALEQVELPEGTVLALEKPFGTDRASAAALNRQLQRIAPESGVQRVDHFLGKSTVLNLLGLRFANRLFESAWSRDHVERVEIVYDEALGLENRAGYYDRAGALVDMIQSHLLLVLALVAMEPPSTLDEDDLRGGMAQALRATTLAPGMGGRRARYTAGDIEGRHFPSYADEEGVDPARETETLAEVEFTVDNWRWAGVPFVLRSGKALGTARKELAITFKPVPHLPTGLRGSARPSRLVIALDPDQLALDVVINGAGDPFDLDAVSLTADFGVGELSAYGEVLHGILTGDPLLSVRGDMAEQCWRIVEPVLAGWRDGSVPLEEYPAGTAGPEGWTAA